MKKIIRLLLCLILSSSFLIAQTKIYLPATPEAQAYHLDQWFAQIRKEMGQGMDADSALTILKELDSLPQQFYLSFAEKAKIQHVQADIHHVILDDYYVAIFYYKRLLDLYQSECDNCYISERMYIYQSLGRIYSYTGNYEQAEYYLQRALNYFEQREEEVQEANCYNALGLLYMRLEYLKKAKKCIFKALHLRQMLGQPEKALIGIYNNLGVIYGKEGQLDSALYYHQKALKLSLQTGQTSSLAGIYRNLGIVYHQQGDYIKATSYYQRALCSYGEKADCNQVNLAGVHRKLGDLYREQAKYALSFRHFQQTLILNSQNFKDTLLTQHPPANDYRNPRLRLLSYQGKARVLQAYYQAEGVLPAHYGIIEEIYLRADSLVQYLQRQMSHEADRLELRKHVAGIYQDAQDFMALCYQKSTDEEKRSYYLERLFYYAESNKNQALLASLQENWALDLGQVPDSLQAVERDLKARKSYLRRQLLLGSRPADYDSLLVLDQHHDTLIRYLEQNYKDYYTSKYGHPQVSLAQVQSLLKANQLMLSYSFGRNQLHIIAVSQQELALRTLPWDESFSRQGVRWYLRRIQQEYRAGFTKLSIAMYEQLLSPVAQSLEGKQEIIVIPDAQLYRLPFETLLDSNQSFVIEKYFVSYAASASLGFSERKIAPTQKARADFLAFAPVFDDSLATWRNEDWATDLTRLPNSEREVNIIAQMFRQYGRRVSLYLRETANLKAMKALQGYYPYIHLATHSVANHASPELSYVAYYPPSEKGWRQAGDSAIYNVFLYTGDIYQLQLETDLLILSSCESGQGKLARGEGVLSLLRAFSYLKTKSVLYSLWKIRDWSTAELMIDFYQYLLEKNLPYTEALGRAKRDYIRKHPVGTPLEWGGLVLMYNQLQNPETIISKK